MFQTTVVISLMMLKLSTLWPTEASSSWSFQDMTLEVLPCFLVCYNAPGTFCVSPAPYLKADISPKSTGSFYMEMVFGNHSMDTRNTHCHCFWALPVNRARTFFFLIMKCFMSSYICPIQIHDCGDFDLTVLTLVFLSPTSVISCLLFPTIHIRVSE